MADSRDLQADEENLLHSALSTAFSPAPLPRQSTSQPQSRRESTITPSVPSDSLPAEPIPSDASSSSTSESWQAEYDIHVQSWRAQSAEAREKAERERARWEAIRAAEHADEASARSEHGWETVGEHAHPPASGSSNVVDIGDLLASEPQGDNPEDSMATPSVPPQTFARPSEPKHERHDTGELSSLQKWEDVASELTSSFPSMSFPEQSSPSHHSPPAPAPAPPLSTTLAVFDSSLPARARVSALLSSLAINVFLPFVNGVMLGFGEIFAKNVIIDWLGWHVPPRPATVASAVGISATQQRQMQERRRS